MIASYWGKTDTVSMLLSKGANKYAKRNDGMTACDIAKYNEYHGNQATQNLVCN